MPVFAGLALRRTIKFEKCVAKKGLTGAFFECVASKGVSGRGEILRLEFWEEEERAEGALSHTT
jgi:hypothetical protein